MNIDAKSPNFIKNSIKKDLYNKTGCYGSKGFLYNAFSADVCDFTTQNTKFKGKIVNFPETKPNNKITQNSVPISDITVKTKAFLRIGTKMYELTADTLEEKIIDVKRYINSAKKNVIKSLKEGQTLESVKYMDEVRNLKEFLKNIKNGCF